MMAVQKAIQKASGSRALFLELVLDLAIFVICAIICLQVFAQAHVESSRSAAQSVLGIEALRVAELFKADYQDSESFAMRLNASCEDDTLTWYYDLALEAVSVDEAHYVLTCVIDDSRPVRVATIMLREGEALLFEYDVSCYAGGGGS